MKPTEIFLLFLKTLTPYERRAFMTELMAKIYLGDNNLSFKGLYYEPEHNKLIVSKTFVERLMYATHFTSNNMGKYGNSASCCCLSSFLRYLFDYYPNIIGNSRKKNKYLEKVDIGKPKIGYKNYWVNTLNKKWHDFLEENVFNYNAFIYGINRANTYDLRVQLPQ